MKKREVFFLYPAFADSSVRKLLERYRHVRSIAQSPERVNAPVHVCHFQIQHQVKIGSEAQIAVSYHGQPTYNQVAHARFIERTNDGYNAVALHCRSLNCYFIFAHGYSKGCGGSALHCCMHCQKQ